MDKETEAWIRLAGVGGLSRASTDSLLAAFGSAAAVVAAGRRAWEEHAVPADSIAALEARDDGYFDRVTDWLGTPGRSVITRASSDYPPLLSETADPPLLLYVIGDATCLPLPQLAVVGSRNPTRGGERTAREFAMHLAASGLAITSGLASGIDTAAHEGAIAAGGRTIAVMGTGIDRVYPAANRGLAHRIVDSGGALVSEFPLGVAPAPWHFPRRNRIIAGLSLGTLVVEAARRSGSLITARLAAEQGREVFAIPGSIHNALARGCHRLIRDGARLVESAEDIFSELEPLVGTLRSTLQKAADSVDSEHASAVRDEDYDKLLDALAWEPVDVETLMERCGLTIAELSSMLLILELEGEVEALPGGKFSRVRQERQP